MAENEVLDGVEAHCPQLQGLLHGGMEILDAEGLEQPQHLHILASPHLQHPRLHQPAQGRELGRQVPCRQGRCLVQGVDLPLDQRKVVDRIEDHVLAVVAAWMARDDLAAAADHDRVDIAADPHLTVAISDRDRVVVGLVAHQRLRADPRRSPMVSDWPRRTSD